MNVIRFIQKGILDLEQNMATQYVQIQKKLEEAHPGYAYELLELQMAIEDDKISTKPSISEITKLIQLYMLGVQILQSVSDPRYAYFNNKIHSLMMKKHIAAKLYESSGRNPKDLSMTAINKLELKEKKNEYEMNCYYNNGLMDLNKVKEILLLAEKRHNQFEGKVKNDIKKQQDRLEQRIKERKMRSETGSVKKYKLGQDVQQSPKHLRDSRNEYFDHQPMMVNSARGNRPFGGSVEKIIQRKYGRIGGYNRQDPRDAI